MEAFRSDRAGEPMQHSHRPAASPTVRVRPVEQGTCGGPLGQLWPDPSGAPERSSGHLRLRQVHGGAMADGTVSVGASTVRTQPGCPGSGAGPVAGEVVSVPVHLQTHWICTDTPLALNDESQAPGGPLPGGWYSVTCVESRQPG